MTGPTSRRRRELSTHRRNGLWNSCGRAHLARIDHIQSMLVHISKAGIYFAHVGAHQILFPLIACEIKIQVLANETFGPAGETPQGILYSVAEEFLAQHL